MESVAKLNEKTVHREGNCSVTVTPLDSPVALFNRNGLVGSFDGRPVNSHASSMRSSISSSDSMLPSSSPSGEPASVVAANQLKVQSMKKYISNIPRYKPYISRSKATKLSTVSKQDDVNIDVKNSDTADVNDGVTNKTIVDKNGLNTRVSKMDIDSEALLEHVKNVLSQELNDFNNDMFVSLDENSSHFDREHSTPGSLPSPSTLHPLDDSREYSTPGSLPSPSAFQPLDDNLNLADIVDDTMSDLNLDMILKG